MDTAHQAGLPRPDVSLLMSQQLGPCQSCKSNITFLSAAGIFVSALLRRPTLPWSSDIDALVRLRRLQWGSPAAWSNAQWLCSQLQHPRQLSERRLCPFRPVPGRPVPNQLSRQPYHKLSPAAMTQLQRQQPCAYLARGPLHVAPLGVGRRDEKHQGTFLGLSIAF